MPDIYCLFIAMKDYMQRLKHAIIWEGEDHLLKYRLLIVFFAFFYYIPILIIFNKLFTAAMIR